MPVSFEQKIYELIDAWADDLHTCCMGVVQSYDKATRLATVLPAAKVRRYDEAGKAIDEQLPLCVNVPVQFPGGRLFVVGLHNLAKDDDCVLQFTHHSIDEWLEKGGMVGGSDERRFSLSDAIATPAPRPKSKPGRLCPDDTMVSGAEDGPYHAVDLRRLAYDIRAKHEVTIAAGVQIILDAPQIYVRKFGTNELVLLEHG